jgi:predicted flap endonuclease-1-like 5' DNA nuclease
MLDILNPCQNESAWWQHLLMLGVPFLLGLLWAKGSGESPDDRLSARLSSLDADLAACRNNTKTAEASLKAATESATTSGNAFVGTSVKAAAISSSSSKPKKDDLKVVEGIGPKIEELFYNAGIYSFEELANTPASRLKEILEAAGSRFQMHDPTTWPAQSKLASEGKWEELKKWQDELNKGNA